MEVPEDQEDSTVDLGDFMEVTVEVHMAAEAMEDMEVVQVEDGRVAKYQCF